MIYKHQYAWRVHVFGIDMVMQCNSLIMVFRSDCAGVVTQRRCWMVSPSLVTALYKSQTKMISGIKHPQMT